jgi:RNA polymerase sigma-70 factor (ECF subfamily)
MNFDRWEPSVRNGRGKVLAWLLRKGFDIIVAEDAVGAAVEAALISWPQHPPQNPEAWLMTVAHRKALDQKRRSQRTVSMEEAEPVVEPDVFEETGIPDERLRLYFLCTHPALDASLQCPLMLQLVVGMTVEQIAELYLVPAPTLAQRLVRVKRKIRDAGILPRLPDPAELPTRVIPVLQAIYGLYFQEWQGAPVPDQALELATILAELLPDHAEALGLAALIALCDSRRRARLSPPGAYVPLEEQDTGNWNFAKIEWGEAYLRQASRVGPPGRFQLEAALQSAHIHRRLDRGPSWSTIVRLYDRLLEHAPTAGFLVGRIAAVGHADGASAALRQLDDLAGRLPEMVRFQPYHATRARLLLDLGRVPEAKESARLAYEGTSSVPERQYLAKVFDLQVPGE